MVKLDRLHKEKSGFTLIEIIVVIIIIAILASLALPRFFRTMERSRAAEALQGLSALRQSLQRCYLSRASYLACSPVNDNTFVNLDVDNPNTLATRLFDYATSASAATTFTLQATRNVAQGGDGASTITITDAGVRTGTGVFGGI